MDAGLLGAEVASARLDAGRAAAEAAGDVDTGGDLPHGKSILPQINALDETPASTKQLAIGLTVTGLIVFPFLPTLFVMAGVVGTWDSEHMVAWSGVPLWHMGAAGDDTDDGVIQMLLRQSLGVDPDQSMWAAQCTAVLFGALFIADVLSEFMPESIRWPDSWNTENRRCCASHRPPSDSPSHIDRSPRLATPTPQPDGLATRLGF